MTLKHEGLLTLDQLVYLFLFTLVIFASVPWLMSAERKEMRSAVDNQTGVIYIIGFYFEEAKTEAQTLVVGAHSDEKLPQDWSFEVHLGKRFNTFKFMSADDTETDKKKLKT